MAISGPPTLILDELKRETMKNKNKFKLCIFIYLCLLALTLLYCSGCSLSNYRRKEYKAGRLVSEVHMFNSTVLMWLKAQNIYAETVDKNGVKRTLAVGDFEQVPDADSIRAVVEGAVIGGAKVLGGGL